MKIGQLYRQAANRFIRENLKDVTGLFIVGYSGITASDLNILRESLRKAGSRMLVVKNSIMKRAFSESDKEGITRFIEGPSSIIFVKDDPVVSAKVLYDFSKDHENLKLKGGLLKDRILDSQNIEMLAKLPSRNVLIAKTVGAIKSPLSSLVFVLEGNLRKLLCVLNEIKKKKEE
ncbi:MAG: 50S ribosomal protein L10 [Candidatus Omnitrophica bacterium]|nr:50S ribosomal protein L10 [Candidatus Omnitrophota bacterium]